MKNKQFFSNKSRKESIMNLGELNNPPMLLNVNFIEALTFWVRGYGVTPPRNEHYGVNDPKIKITIGTDNAVECYASDIFSTWWFVNSPLLSYSDAVKAIVDLKEKGLDCTIQRQGWVDIPDYICLECNKDGNIGLRRTRSSEGGVVDFEDTIADDWFVALRCGGTRDDVSCDLPAK